MRLCFHPKLKKTGLIIVWNMIPDFFNKILNPIRQGHDAKETAIFYHYPW
jgi:hypothetical protein